VGWSHIPDLGWRRRPKLHGMQEVRRQLGPKGVALRGPYAVGTDARID
jgi:hypothetical protein